MSTTGLGTDTSTKPPEPGTVDMGLEVVTLPVADVDRSKRFYEGLGWRLDADIVRGDDFRVIQFTPPHSQCSIHFGVGLTSSAPGSADRMILAVKNINAARDELISRGVNVTEVEDMRPPGPTRQPARTSCTPRSKTQMATDGCCSRSRPGCPDGNGRTDHGHRWPGRAAPRNIGAPRFLRGDRPAARLVGLVCGLHGCARARKLAG